MSDRLTGKVAIVTGAGQTEGREIGNGRATAIAFGREGANVVLADRDEGSARRDRDGSRRGRRTWWRPTSPSRTTAARS